MSKLKKYQKKIHQHQLEQEIKGCTNTHRRNLEVLNDRLARIKSKEIPFPWTKIILWTPQRQTRHRIPTASNSKCFLASGQECYKGITPVPLWFSLSSTSPLYVRTFKKWKTQTRTTNQPTPSPKANQTDLVGIADPVPQDTSSWEDVFFPAQWKNQDSAW